MLQIDWVSDTTLTEAVLLALAFVLSSVIGLERHRRVKAAGLRTHALVGTGTAVFTLISAYGFATVVGPDAIADPSRIAAQIVSGIGFLGAGVIFVRQNVVSGLTTAASIWLTAAVGMACGAGAPVLAAMATGLYLLAVLVLPRVAERVQQIGYDHTLLLRYREGRGALRASLSIAATHGFEATLTRTRADGQSDRPWIDAEVTLRSRRPIAVDDLLEKLADVPGMGLVRVGTPDD